MSERIPQHIQNIILRDYCKKKSLTYFLSGVEYTQENSYLMLNSIISDLKNLDGIIAYSLFQFPENNTERKKVFLKILKKKKVVYFACEDLKVSNIKDLEKVEKIWLIKKSLKNYLNEDYEKIKKFCN